MRETRDAERRLAKALAELRMPDEAQAEARAWELIDAAHRNRTRTRTPSSFRRIGLALAAGALALAVGLSPAGAEVGELVQDVGRAIGIGAEDAKPALRSLPAAGELLVESETGVWIVREDGSRRLLGDYEDAAFSPRGLFVAAATERQLVALDPLGEVRWSISAPGRVSDPRWSPSGYRIAYRSGDDLRVVAGDGTGDRLLARGIDAAPPAWSPLEPRAKLDPGGVGSHVLVYVERDGATRAIDVDSGRPVPLQPRALEELSAPATGGTPHGRAASPAADAIATIGVKDGRDRLIVSREGRRRPVTLFSARGRLTGPTWSPDGRWILIGWPQADQWLFIRDSRPGRFVAFDRISEQFGPGGPAGGFPRVSDWILPER